jgi:hypothetical protein
VEATNTRVNRRTLYDVHLRFKDKRGKDQRGTASTTESALLADARAGRPIPIEYDPDEPSRLRFAGARASFFGAFAFLPMFFSVAGGPLFVLGLLSARSTRRLYRYGEIAEGTVTRITSTMSTQNRRRVQLMHYQFDSPRGPMGGAWKTVAPALVGARLWVLYDRERPELSIPAEP